MDATFAGYNDYYAAEMPVCPHPPGSKEAADWWAGWSLARREDTTGTEEKKGTDD